MESCWLSRNHSASSAVIMCVDGGQCSAICPARAASALAHPTGLKPGPSAVKVKSSRPPRKVSLFLIACDLEKKKKKPGATLILFNFSKSHMVETSQIQIVEKHGCSFLEFSKYFVNCHHTQHLFVACH